jgi:hypothetical protein
MLCSLPVSADIATLGWMAGCWSQDGAEPGSVEQWTMPAGGTMLGMSRTVSDGETFFFEYLRIVENQLGWTGLIASPYGEDATRFEMTAISPDEVVFENAEHDFPQRISYRSVTKDKLLGRIEGLVDGDAKVAEFPMTRIDCENPGRPKPPADRGLNQTARKLP